VGITDAFVQMAAAAAAAGLLGALTGAVILRTRALTLLMLTLAITSIILEIANKATWLTGGADGLSGVVVAPILAPSSSICSAGLPSSIAWRCCSSAGSSRAG